MSKNHREADQNISHHLEGSDLLALKKLNYFLIILNEDTHSLKFDCYKSINLIVYLRQKADQMSQIIC